MSYLVQLKKIESEKYFNNSLLTEVPKVSKDSFDTFDTSVSVELNKNLSLIQSWLHEIGEPPEDHYSVLVKCRNDPEALEYFLKHARGEF